MSQSLKLLQVEDSETDADFIVRALEKNGFVVQHTRVEDSAGMSAALGAGDWDVITADYNLPSFNAPEALAVLQTTGRDIPFIVVSGAIGEDLAVAMMKAGANDYVLKSNLARLAPAVERELRDARARWDRKQAEDALRQSQELFRIAFEGSAIGMALVSNDGRLSSVNGALCEMLGYSREDLVGQYLQKITHPEDREAEAVVAGPTTGEPAHIGVEKRYIRKNGDVILAQVHSAVLHDRTGAAAGSITQIQDITGRRLAEERLRQAQKLESIGLLAGGIAHDFNNILTAVSGNLTLAIEDLCPTCEIKSILEVAVQSVERAAGLTRQLLAYAGKGAFVRTRVSISEIADKTIQLLRASTPKNVELRTNLASNLPPLFMDPSQMEQVCMNLVLNGVEAIGDKRPGVVTVTTDRANGFLRLVVSDTGSGMDEATRKRIFEPFFTTKFLGRGLGLAAVDGIVRALKGEIAVESAVGNGARFQILLPVPQIPDLTPIAGAKLTHRPAHGITVLIVDDEPQVRKMAAAFLKRKGIRVVEASTGKEAIEILAASGEEIRAVLLDMAMPELSGDQALPIMLKLRPDLQVIVSSGYGEIEVKQHFAKMNIRSYLPKPYGCEELLAHILPAVSAGPAPPVE